MTTTRLGSVVIGASLVAAVLSGCTDTAEEPTPEVRPGRTPQQTDAPSTPEQWALIAEGQSAQWDSWQENWEAVSCGSIADSAAGGIDCTLLVFNAGTLAELDANEWAMTTTPGTSGFISVEPPAEVADLVASIQAAATTAATAGQEWVAAGCDMGTGGDCATLSASFDAALVELRAQRAEWESFLSVEG